MKRALTVSVLALLSFPLFCTPAFCDRGFFLVDLIMPNGQRVKSGTRAVKFFEPNQNALIAFDGNEEILYLTTDLSASHPSKVLEVLPLPSEPKVTKGDPKTLRDAVQLLNSKLMPPYSGSAHNANSKGMHPMSIVPPAAVIVSHEQLGAHDISVVKVLDSAKFVEWTEANLTKLGSTSPTVPEWIKEKIKTYTESGFNWFAFDVVELQPKLKSIEPLRYRFATKQLFYPLQITRVNGQSSVKLIVLTSGPLKPIGAIKGAKFIQSSKAFPLHKADMSRLDPEMNKLLDKSPSFDRPVIQMWELQNSNGRDYEGDLVARLK